MSRFIFLLFLALLAIPAPAKAQQVNGRIKSTGEANLHVIRLYADSFPQVSLIFHAENSAGQPVWNLEAKDLRVEEEGRTGRITKFRPVSQEQHLQTMLVLDHSGSMARDWRYDKWYNELNWDTIPSDTFYHYYRCNCVNTSSGIIANEGWTDMPCECGATQVDSVFTIKRIPFYYDYKSPLMYAQEGARVFVRSMSGKGDSTGIVGFSDTPDLYLPYAADNERTAWAINGMQATGSTAFYDAIDRSLNHLVYHRGLRAIVALTDGKDNASLLNLDQLISKAKKMRCPVYVIGLGDVDPVSLTRLAAETGGELYLTNDAKKLEDVFAQIAGKLKSVYELVYESPFLKSEEPTHELRLRFDVDSMYLRSQIVDLPLPESVVEYLEEKEEAQQDLAGQFPLTETEAAESPEPVTENVSVIAPANEEEREFPYGALGITLAVAGAGTLVYRKTQKNRKNSVSITNLFPNPTPGPFQLSYSANGFPGAGRLTVTDANGVQVYVQALSSPADTVSVNLEQEAPGMYFACVEMGGEKSISRFIIQR